MTWFLKAAEGENVYSQEAWMYFYIDGDGVETNVVESSKWALRAAMNGNVNAQIRMIHAYGEGFGVKKTIANRMHGPLLPTITTSLNLRKSLNPCFQRARQLEKEIKQIAELRSLAYIT